MVSDLHLVYLEVTNFYLIKKASSKREHYLQGGLFDRGLTVQ